MGVEPSCLCIEHGVESATARSTHRIAICPDPVCDLQKSQDGLLEASARVEEWLGSDRLFTTDKIPTAMQMSTAEAMTAERIPPWTCAPNVPKTYLADTQAHGLITFDNHLGPLWVEEEGSDGTAAPLNAQGADGVEALTAAQSERAPSSRRWLPEVDAALRRDRLTSEWV